MLMVSCSDSDHSSHNNHSDDSEKESDVLSCGTHAVADYSKEEENDLLDSSSVAYSVSDDCDAGYSIDRVSGECVRNTKNGKGRRFRLARVYVHYDWSECSSDKWDYLTYTLKEATAVWNSIKGSSLELVVLPPGHIPQERNVISARCNLLDEGISGVAYSLGNTEFNSMHILDPWFPNTMIHELGHVVGLWEHDPNPDSTMYGAAGYNKNLTANDKKRIIERYPEFPDGVRSAEVCVKPINWASWIESSTDKCSFTCKAGYRVNGKTCERKRSRMAVAASHSCLLLENGSVKCWGNNTYAQVTGDSSYTSNSQSITKVSGLGGQVVDIRGGYRHTCAILKDGSVKCWGFNHRGQVSGGSSPSNSQSITKVSGLGGQAVDIATGGSHTCALLSNGSVKCWGSNHAAQVTGDGIPSDMESVTQISGLGEPAVAIASRAAYTCALLSDGSVKCWGENIAAQVTGDGISSDMESVTQVPLNEQVTSIVAGMKHMCAFSRESHGFVRSVKCWGSNNYAQVTGDGIPSDVQSVTQVLSEEHIVDMAASWEHTCILLSYGSVKCWGRDNRNQVGVFRSLSPSSYRSITTSYDSSMSDLDPGIDIGAGGAHSCVLLGDDNVKCWGHNGYNQVTGDSSSLSGRGIGNLRL